MWVGISLEGTLPHSYFYVNPTNVHADGFHSDGSWGHDYYLLSATESSWYCSRGLWRSYRWNAGETDTCEELHQIVFTLQEFRGFCLELLRCANWTEVQ